jgi:hypothetical protein
MHQSRINIRLIGQVSLIFSGLIFFILTGCSMGPKTLPGNRLDYNVSVQKSNKEELLINIVRARYVEPLFFLQVGSISSSFGYSANVGASATFFHNLQNSPPLGDYYTPSIGAGISETPTITYSPLQGEKAVRQLQSEMKLDRFLLLTRTGWSIESLMWLTVVQVGELQNFAVGISSGDLYANSYSKFLDLSHLLNVIQLRGDLEFVSLSKGESGGDSLHMQLRYLDQTEAEKLEALLGIHPERVSLPENRFLSTIELTSVRDFMPCNRNQRNCSRVPIKLKSFFGILVDLALYVDIGADEQKKKVATPFKELPGELKFRHGLHAGLVRIKRSAEKPADAYVAVPYRNHWFYVADEDIHSKAYLMLVGSIYSLQSGDLQSAAPLLTLPVGR